jgi:hypothetical protein
MTRRAAAKARGRGRGSAAAPPTTREGLGLGLAVTAHPLAAWMWRQLVEAAAGSRRPKHFIGDRDTVYGGGFRARAVGQRPATP